MSDWLVPMRRANKFQLRDQIIEELRLNPGKKVVAAKLGITERYLNMVLNLEPHWSATKKKLRDKEAREKLKQELTARGLRPGCRANSGV